MFDTKHNVSQAKDKERLIRLTFQECFLVSFIISLAIYFFMIISFFLFIFLYTVYIPLPIPVPILFFPLFFVYNLNRNYVVPAFI